MLRDLAKLGSVDNKIAALLMLQKCDKACADAEYNLLFFPGKILEINKQIALCEKRAVDARTGFNQFEIKRRDLDNKLKAAENQVITYKNQQLQVKKNEEYQALTHQIETLQTEISTIEEDELELLLKIDEEKKVLIKEEQLIKAEIATLQKDIAAIQQQETEIKGKITTLRADVATAKAAVDPIYLKAYEAVKTRVKKAPYVSAIKDHQCKGCFMRTSNEVVSAVHKADKPVHCDNCGRLLYLED